MDRIPSWMKGYGLLVFRSAYRAWELTGFVVAMLCLGIAYVALGSLTHAPIPSNTGPAMRSQIEMGHRLGRTLQWGCLGLGGLFVAGAIASRGFRDQ